MMLKTIPNRALQLIFWKSYEHRDKGLMAEMFKCFLDVRAMA